MQQLPASTVRLIGSSQVITSVSSVVKELIENSLDAGASNIDVKLEDFGFSKIEIRDNGCGIPVESTSHMGVLHYTSKISAHDDLSSLVTYGFRGEALGSLCAVGNVSVTTKTDDDVIGYTYKLNHSGAIISKTPSHQGTGSTVCVEGLFENLPVRKQFYNSSRKRRDEMKRVERLVKCYILIQPGVRFTLRRDRETIIPGTVYNKLSSALTAVLGPATVALLQHHHVTNDLVEIEAYLPRPGSDVIQSSVSSNDQCFIFINQRPVEDKQMEKLLRREYQSCFECDKSRCPVSYLSVRVDPSRLDVNLEPNKTRVLIHNKEDVHNLLEELLSKAFCKPEPEVTFNDDVIEENRSIVLDGLKNHEKIVKSENDFDVRVTSLDVTSDVGSKGVTSTTDVMTSATPDDVSDMMMSHIVNQSETVIGPEVTSSLFDQSDVSEFNGELPVVNEQFGRENRELFSKFDPKSDENYSQIISSDVCEEIMDELRKMDSRLLEKEGVENNNFSKYANPLPVKSRTDSRQLEFSFTNESESGEKQLSLIRPEKQLIKSASVTSTSFPLNLQPKINQVPANQTLITDHVTSVLANGASGHVTGNFCRVSNTSGRVTDTSASVTNTSGHVANTSAPVTNTSGHVANTSASVTNTSGHVSNGGRRMFRTAFQIFSHERSDLGKGELETCWERMNVKEKDQYEQKEMKERERYWYQIMSEKKPLQPSNKKRKVECRPVEKSFFNRHSRVVNYNHRALVDKYRTNSWREKIQESAQRSSRPLSFVGGVKSVGACLAMRGRELLLVNQKRMEEVIVYRDLCRKHQLNSTRLHQPLLLNESLESSSLKVLEGLEYKQDDTGYYVSDPRITYNGFIIRRMESDDVSTDDVRKTSFTLDSVTSDVELYSAADLEEILQKIKGQHDVTMAECRPHKIMNHLKNVTVHHFEKSSQIIEDVETIHELFKQFYDICEEEKIDLIEKSCLHDKECVRMIFDIKPLIMCLKLD